MVYDCYCNICELFLVQKHLISECHRTLCSHYVVTYELQARICCMVFILSRICVIFKLVCLIKFVMPVFQKITARNAFSLQLIDYMALMLKKQDAKMDNFQVKRLSHLTLSLCFCSHFGPVTVGFVVYMSLRCIVLHLLQRTKVCNQLS